jgi:hypothetical protein
MTERVVTNCTASSKNGQPCKKRTSTSKLCWQHMQSMEGLRVKDSRVVGAGKGLFAAKDYKKGEVVAEYNGRHVAKDAEGPYVFSLAGAPYDLDGARSSCPAGRFANDKRASIAGANVVAKVRKTGGHVDAAHPLYFQAEKRIPEGREVFIHYGADYWRTAGIPKAALLPETGKFALKKR